MKYISNPIATETHKLMSQFCAAHPDRIQLHDSVCGVGVCQGRGGRVGEAGVCCVGSAGCLHRGHPPLQRYVP